MQNRNWYFLIASFFVVILFFLNLVIFQFKSVYREYNQSVEPYNFLAVNVLSKLERLGKSVLSEPSISFNEGLELNKLKEYRFSTLGETLNPTSAFFIFATGGNVKISLYSIVIYTTDGDVQTSDDSTLTKWQVEAMKSYTHQVSVLSFLTCNVSPNSNTL